MGESEEMKSVSWFYQGIICYFQDKTLVSHLQRKTLILVGKKRRKWEKFNLWISYCYLQGNICYFQDKSWVCIML